jgi:hypothetical protein
MQEFDPATRQSIKELPSMKDDQPQIKRKDWMDQTCPRFILVRTVGSVGIYSKIKKELVSNRTQISHGC